ncbi:hypothetical protein AVEN_31426-1 [Araneus ventricosus]|uniref:Uncharacterized protein n=1 Tax=Araneus ventricosus TaxID=182803 RepID=A0A4Y2UBG9_ARAVE|nr:hypothetical protein AVEN_31426-1 [Araneus ventricosus]
MVRANEKRSHKTDYAGSVTSFYSSRVSTLTQYYIDVCGKEKLKSGILLFFISQNLCRVLVSLSTEWTLMEITIAKKCSFPIRMSVLTGS